MAPMKCVIVGSKVWGQLPSWEILEFETVEDYENAYKAEENDIVDGLAELEADRIIEYPEDFVYA